MCTRIRGIFTLEVQKKQKLPGWPVKVREAFDQGVKSEILREINKFNFEKLQITTQKVLREINSRETKSHKTAICYMSNSLNFYFDEFFTIFRP